MYKLYLSSMARYTDLKTNEFQTCLSKKVYHILCDTGVKSGDVHLQLVDDKKLLNWKSISTLLPDYTQDSYEYFVESVESLAVVLKGSYDELISLTPEQFHKHYSPWLQWTSIPKVLQHCFELVKNGGNTRPVESLLLSTTVLERSLGDIYLLKGSKCPSMLKDLLVTPQLTALLGDTVLQLLRVIIGPPISLNIRNVLWHGFPSPGEMNPRYSMFMLHLLASLGYLLEEQGIAASQIKHRPFVFFPSVHKLQFSSLSMKDSAHPAVINLFRQSSFVLPQMLEFWTRAVELYFKERYDECIVLLLPQLEHALRRVFTIANKCPARLLTAENTTLFTTFDEILHHTLEDGSPNLLHHYIGCNRVTMLLDLFMYPEGPRIRDRLSHGECALLFTETEPMANCVEHGMEGHMEHAEYWKRLANGVLAVTISFCMIFLPNDDIIKSHRHFQQILHISETYESTFHPLSLLQTELIESANILSKWAQSERPSDMDIAEAWNMNNEDKTVDVKLLEAGKAVLCSCSKFMQEEYLIEFLQPFARVVDHLTRHRFHIDTLYRYKSDLDSHNDEANKNVLNKEEEVVGLLRRMLTQCRAMCAGVLSLCTARYQQWNEKSLRSRQRNTYQRMLNTIPELSSGVKLVLLITRSFLYKISEPSTWTREVQLKDVKFLKKVLQYIENMSVFTSAEKNRWEEAQQLNLQFYEQCSKLL